jgi:hypothetical protein
MEEGRLRFYDFSCEKPSYYFVLGPPGTITGVDYSGWLGMASTSCSAGVVQTILCPAAGERYPDFGMGTLARRSFQSLQLTIEKEKAGGAAGGGGGGGGGPPIHFITDDFNTELGENGGEGSSGVVDNAGPPGPRQCTSTVRWSPNQSSKFVLATGTGSGMVLLQNLRAVGDEMYDA